MTGLTSARLNKVAFSVMDSATSSLGNFCVSLAAVRTLSLADFGIFSGYMLGGFLALGLSRALHAEPFILVHGGAGGPDRQRAAQQAVSSLLVVSLSASALLLLGLLLGRALGAPGAWLLPAGAFASVLPVLLLQDFLRSVEYVSSRPARALANNAAWTSFLLLAIGALASTSRASVASFILAWGLSAATGCVVGVWSTGLSLRLRPSLLACRGEGGMRVRLLTDFALIQTTAEAVLLLIGFVAGSDQLGLLRTAQLPLAPTVVITAGLISFLQPAMVRRVSSGESFRAMARLAWRIGTGGALASLALALGVYFAPHHVLSAVVGSDWSRARAIVPWVGLSLSLGFLAAALGVAIRACGLLREQVRIRYLLALPTLALVGAGAHVGGAAAAAQGLCLSLAVGVAAAGRVLAVARPAPRPLSVPVEGDVR